MEQETNPEAFRGAVDYLHSSAQGAKELDDHVSKLMEPGEVPTHMQEMAKESSRNELKEKLNSIRTNPSQLLGVSGNLGHYLPNHAVQLGAMSATATEYLESLRPKPIQGSPLDAPQKPDPISEDAYNRQLDIANHPLSVIGSIRRGTLRPQDMTTLHTIYPKLAQALVSKIGEEIINHKSKGMDVPYGHLLSLSMVLGQPLDGSMTSQAMMAIISSAAGAQSQQAPHQKAPTAQALKQINKVDQMTATDLQAREMGRKE